MTLKDIATISGKGGLFQILKPAKTGMLLESLDDTKTKLVATPNHKLSVLDEISIYTTTKEGTIALADVFKKIHATYNTDIGLDAEADPAELKAFLKSVLPEYDENRVYISDIKKLVRWYGILVKYLPESLVAEPSGQAENDRSS